MPTFDRQSLAALRAAIDAALRPVSAAHGVALSIGSISFQADRATTRLTMTALPALAGGAEASSDPLALERAVFAAHAAEVGLTADDYGTLVRLGGREYRLVAVRRTSPKFPIIGRTARGTDYKLPVEDVLRALGRPSRGGTMAAPLALAGVR